MDFVSIDRSTLPAEEHEAARSLELNLAQLQRLAQEFRFTVQLYLFAHKEKLENDKSRAEGPWRFISWMNTAARSGAITAYGFARLMEEINSMNAPTIRSKVDMETRKKATKLFAAEFPTIAGIRTSAAHPGEFSASKEETDKHRIKEAGRAEGLVVGEDSGVFLEGFMSAGMDGPTYSSSFKGKLVDYKLSMQKADVLDEVARLYCAAYQPLESAASAQMREVMRAADERLRRD